MVYAIYAHIKPFSLCPPAPYSLLSMWTALESPPPSNSFKKKKLRLIGVCAPLQALSYLRKS